MNILHQIPMSLVVLRFLLAPVLLLACYMHVDSFVYVILLVIGFLSDVFDGIIARRLGVSTDKLRSMDSWADTVFYAAVFLVSIMLHSDKLWVLIFPIAILVMLELIRHGYEKWKFGKSASYHMWSAKLWGIFLFLGFVQLLGFGETGVLFVLAIIMGIVTDIEGLIASFILSHWKADVPSVYHAYILEKNRKLDAGSAG